MMKWLIAAGASLFLLQLGLAAAQTKAPVEKKSETKKVEPTAQPSTQSAAGDLYSFSPKSIAGKETSLAQYKGKTLLIVNVASKCGYTPQYEGLEALYKKYHDKGFEILGFPSNDFLSQEPGTNQEIQQFCKLNYGVTFPLFEKAPVKGSDKQPLYQYLTTHSPKGNEGDISWNFEKFLISPKGEIVERWKSKVKPESAEVAKAIESQLASQSKVQGT